MWKFFIVSCVEIIMENFRHAIPFFSFTQHDYISPSVPGEISSIPVVHWSDVLIPVGT
jgi:hypothetical protein